MLRFVLCIIFMSGYFKLLAQESLRSLLMTFYTCEGSCTPNNRSVQLADSDDGINWLLLDSFEPFIGDAPDIISRGNKLYLYTSGKVIRYEKSNNSWESLPSEVSIKDINGNEISWIQPSAIVNDNGNLELFYLNTTGLSTNPESCNPYPCTKYFDSAIEVAGSDGTEFIQQSGHRLTLTIFSGTASKRGKVCRRRTRGESAKKITKQIVQKYPLNKSVITYQNSCSLMNPNY